MSERVDVKDGGHAGVGEGGTAGHLDDDDYDDDGDDVDGGDDDDDDGDDIDGGDDDDVEDAKVFKVKQ